jgi:hypothetical protein
MGAEVGAVVGAGVALGFSVAATLPFFTTIPLLQTNFLPDLMQVYLKPPDSIF